MVQVHYFDEDMEKRFGDNEYINRHIVKHKKMKSLLSKIDFSCDDCWLWTGYLNGGRPTTEIAKVKLSVKHIMMITLQLELFENWNPEATQIVIDNHCGNDLCVNPDHHSTRGTWNGFWQNYNDDGHNTGICWNWEGSKMNSGYGTYSLNGYPKNRYAHRLAHMFHYETDDDAEVIMHLCDNRLCVNPHHLKAATHAENQQDTNEKGRRHNMPWEKALEIKYAILDSGLKHREIAEKFGVKVDLIYDIANDRSWTLDKYNILPDGRNFRECYRKKYDLVNDETGELYVIENKLTGLVYVGVTLDKTERRLSDHMFRLRTGIHWCDAMLLDYNNHGEGSFEMVNKVKISNCNWKDAEIALIHQYRDKGYKLYNTEHA